MPDTEGRLSPAEIEFVARGYSVTMAEQCRRALFRGIKIGMWFLRYIRALCIR